METQMNSVYWGDIPNNFGDVLTGNLLTHFGIKYKHTNVPEYGTMYVIGSIARLASADSTVLGSGMIRKGEYAEPTATWRFVRGPRTRANVLEHGGTCPDVYGDPALLLPIFCPESSKKYEIGLVPHYEHFNYFKYKYPDHYIIDVVNKDPLEVARQISSCKKIISSSLHGIIAAHAYGIPAAHVLGPKKLHGDGSKFDDHYEAMQVEHIISTVENPVYSDAKIPNLQNIIEIFEEYSQ